MSLHVPEVADDDSILEAAIKYAQAGWYVVPVAPDTKAPTPLGKGWHHQSSRDVDVLASWFAGTDYLLGLHCGRSGAVVFDVDHPEHLPEALRRAFNVVKPPHQSTRLHEPGRGHYVFAFPEGRALGNSRGSLGKEWGEVRGLNGIIVVEPSTHTKESGRYHWLRTGTVPPLPDEVAALLPDGKPGLDAASDSTVARFMSAHTRASMPATVGVILEKFRKDQQSGASRHEAATTAAAWIMRDAKAGLLNAADATESLHQAFVEAMQGERGRPVESEWQGIVAWAVGQAEEVDADQRREEVERRLGVDAFGEPLVISEPPTPNFPEVRGSIRDSAAYFAFDPVTRKIEPKCQLMASDVLAMGPLARGRDNRFWMYEGGVWRPEPTVVRRRLTRMLYDRYRPAYWTAVDHIIDGMDDLTHLSGDPVEPFINFKNGMLEWRTGQMLAHDPSYKSTIQLPFAWDAAAACPKFDRWLSEILSDDYRELMWQIIGYLMLNGNPMQVAFLFLGRGRNGKGTLMRVLRHLLGDDNVASVSLNDLNGNRFAPADLYGKAANLAGDIDATFQESTARFKSLTGEDLFYAERKNEQGFNFQNWAVPVFSANRVPGSADTSEGYTRRWVVVQFARMISDAEKIIGLDQRFVAELPGIAAKGVEALRGLMKAGGFKADGDVAAGKAEFEENIDQVRQWVADWCEPEDPTFSEARTVLYDSYKMWAFKNGHGQLKATEFYHRLENARFRMKKVNGIFRFEGIRVKTGRMRQELDPLPA